MKLSEVKIGQFYDYHYKDDPKGTWRWMQIKSLSDDNTTIYFISNGGGGFYSSASLEDIIVDKIG